MQMDRSWITKGVRRLSYEHLRGVDEFIVFARRNAAGAAEILCPCPSCNNRTRQTLQDVESHLLLRGMAATYDRWIHHGEPLHAEPGAEPGHQPDAHHADEGGEHLEDDHVVLENSFNLVEEDGDEDDRIPDLFKDLYESEPQGDGQNTIYAELIEEAKRSASDGGTMSRFAFTVKLLHVKSFYRMSNAALNGILHLLAIQYPKSSIPKNYDEALSIIGRLGLGYESIHVCPSNCVLFRKTYAKLDKCPKCDASRWKDGDGRKQIPEKVLRYFPIIPRLQRMFISKKQSEEVQWHKLKRKPVTNELSHPADGKAWKDFDSQHKDFAADARNIRLGLATDGFNPFGMSRKYSMWPVFIVPYNLPPWACMDQSNFMMALLIPGPDSPGKDFDIFMEPLVEDLFKLWNGVQTYDALSPDKFNLRDAVIWCIHDFPALHTLSGRLTAGYQACVRCDKDPCSERIRNKLCWIGSRRFLPLDHRWRKSKGFNGNTEPRDPPAEFTKEELKQQLDKVKGVRPGKNQKKRKREEGQCWDRRSILWDLPYWADLKLRHNLDVMHIDKNICDNLLGTFMNIDGKSKDTLNSRLDLEDMGIREALHLRPVDGGKSFEMPEAWYTMTKEEKIAFCEFIRAVRFPDGYAANLAKCVSPDGCKLQGLKTHDCHILLQRILPAGLRGIMDKEIYEAVAELGNFFKELCSKTLKLSVLERLDKEIPIILCKLEKIFPPAFFTVMVHLAVHLPKEAILRGPVQYGWMYPVERRMLTFKRYVRNTARPEGSIAEAYIVDECLTFCSRYFDDLETRFNRPGRNIERDDSHSGDVSVFSHGVKFLGGSQYLEAGDDYEKMHWYVLRSCQEVLPYIEYVIYLVHSYFFLGLEETNILINNIHICWHCRLCKKELEEQDSRINVHKWLANGFAGWFKKHVSICYCTCTLIVSPFLLVLLFLATGHATGHAPFISCT